MNKEKIIDLLERRLLFLMNKLSSNNCSREDFLMGMGALEEVEQMLDIMKGEMYNE